MDTHHVRPEVSPCMVAAKPAIATMATTTNALRRDFGFATSGACGIERVSGRVLSMN